DALDAQIGVHVYGGALAGVRDPIHADQSVRSTAHEGVQQRRVVGAIGDDVSPGEQEIALADGLSSEQQRAGGTVPDGLAAILDVDAPLGAVAEMCLDLLRAVAGD